MSENRFKSPFERETWVRTYLLDPTHPDAAEHADKIVAAIRERSGLLLDLRDACYSLDAIEEAIARAIPKATQAERSEATARVAEALRGER